jgi:hypothetical protein
MAQRKNKKKGRLSAVRSNELLDCAIDLPDTFGKLGTRDEIIEMEPFFPADWSPNNPKYFLPDDIEEAI